MPSPLRPVVVTGCTTLAVLAGLVITSAAPAAAIGSEPTIASLSPAFGQVGSPLDIDGTGYAAGDTVTVGRSEAVTVTAAEVSNGGDDITLPVPSDATTGAVTVTDPLSSTTVTGPTFTVQRVGRSTASVSHRTVVSPHHVTVAAVLTVAGKAARGQHAGLQQRYRGSHTWRHTPGTTTRTTGRHGKVHFTVVPKANVAYRVVFAASPTVARDVTGAHSVGVHPRLDVHVPSKVTALSAFAVTGTVHPSLRGSVDLQRKTNGHWHQLKALHVKHGAFSTTLTEPKAGLFRYRVIRPGDVQHLRATGGLHVVTATLRDLVDGDHGSDVLRLQKRLKHLHYDVGAVNGTFGYDTLHAVTAFQKVQGISRSGKVTQSVYKKLAHPRVMHLRHPVSGTTAIEVDLARQVVLFAKDGHITRIIDASSAGGYYFTDSEGKREKAVTPTGHFTIQYKINGWHKSKLGELYRPAYFTNDGYAIHGETSVPNYPASHGCVRITVPAMDRLYDKIYVGMSVWIY